MVNCKTKYYFVFVLLPFFALNLHAQYTGDDFKRSLKNSIHAADNQSVESELKYQLFQVRQNSNDVLQVSPTTKLPSKFDKIELNEPILPIDRIHLDLNVTNINSESQLERSSIDYSDGKVHEIPDARSVSQSVQHTRNDYGLGVYADKDSPEWLMKLRNKTSCVYRDIDLDPIRFFRRLRAQKHKIQVDKIKKVYNQD